MRAIILSAGQGRRLLPYTRNLPKCLLSPCEGPSILELQLRVLTACGVPRATVVVGFGAEEVERHIEELSPTGIEVETLYNPFFESTDNLVTAWLARERMRSDFLLVNGDTLFEPALLRRVLGAPRAAATITTDRKRRYDADDMKVSLDDYGRLLAVSKTLKPEEIDGEAIGMIRFNAEGGSRFVEGLERAVRDRGRHSRYYLSVVSENAASGGEIQSVSIEGLWWQEVDSAEDLTAAQQTLAGKEAPWCAPGPPDARSEAR